MGRKTWNGTFSFAKRKTGLGGWFVVVGNLRLFLSSCLLCGRPVLKVPVTHFTNGNIEQAKGLKSWLLENGIGLGGDSYCKGCVNDVVYTSDSGHVIW